MGTSPQPWKQNSHLQSTLASEAMVCTPDSRAPAHWRDAGQINATATQFNTAIWRCPHTFGCLSSFDGWEPGPRFFHPCLIVSWCSRCLQNKVCKAKGTTRTQNPTRTQANSKKLFQACPGFLELWVPSCPILTHVTNEKLLFACLMLDAPTGVNLRNGRTYQNES